MVELSINDDILDVTVLGWSMLWALKRRIRVPIAAVRSIRHEKNVRRWTWPGWRFPGTFLPGVITAGTYRWRGKKSFWDVRRSGRAVVLELEGAAYDRLVVDVRDPAAAASLVRGAIWAGSGG